MALVSGMVGDLAERHGAPSRGPERLLGCVWVGREGRSRGGVFGLMIERGRRARPRAVLGLGPPFRLRPAAVASQPIGATGGVCPPSLKRAPGCPEVPNAAAEGSHTTFRAAARQAGVGAALRGTQSRAVACIKGPGRLCPGRRAQPSPLPGEGSWLLRARAAGEQTLAAQRRQVACARGRGGRGIQSLLAPPGARRVATHRPGRQARPERTPTPQDDCRKTAICALRRLGIAPSGCVSAGRGQFRVTADRPRRMCVHPNPEACARTAAPKSSFSAQVSRTC